MLCVSSEKDILFCLDGFQVGRLAEHRPHLDLDPPGDGGDRDVVGVAFEGI